MAPHLYIYLVVDENLYFILVIVTPKHKHKKPFIKYSVNEPWKTYVISIYYNVGAAVTTKQF